MILFGTPNDGTKWIDRIEKALKDWTTHMIGHELTALFGIDHTKITCDYLTPHF